MTQMARREAYAYVRPPSEEEKDFPQVLKVEGSGCGDTPHERHCQVARSEVRRQRLRGATQMAVLGGDAVFPL